MYQYNAIDQKLVDERVAQFRDQTQRFLAGKISDEDFRPLRLMNGLYLQTHAPMLRIAVPYGLLASEQLRMLAHIARTYDKGYAHFTTRQNLQYNWPTLESVPDILADLAKVQMHAIQTSGNCIRNVTCDHLAGIAVDEIEDPRPYCEILRQWATLHPEFAYLPRKFKIAVSGAERDRAATQVHDIGLHLVRNDQGEIGFEVLVGGGLGRTPMIGQRIKSFLPKKDLLTYLEAVLRVYNQYGRRDNKYKARIKILVKETGLDEFSAMVDEEWQHTRKEKEFELTDEAIASMRAHFDAPEYQPSSEDLSAELFNKQRESNKDFDNWVRNNTGSHRVEGYAYAFISLKAPGIAPGDISADQMDAVADIADEFSFGLIRSTHRQNLLLSDIRKSQLFDLWQKLDSLNLATPNIDTASDMICCPGLEYCSLANASSIGISTDIYSALEELDYLHDLGDLKINISGCMNGCAHQSVGHIGILGVDKKGAEWYQITLGGSSDNEAAIGERLGPAVAKDQIVSSVVKLLDTYVDQRKEGETFLEMVRRTGIEPFKENIYADH